MKTQRFTRDLKILKADEFSSVFNFKKRFHSEYFIFHFQPNEERKARLGLVAGKRVAKSAVKRNYMRRVLREAFRKNEQIHDVAVDLVLNVKKPFNKTHFNQVETSFNQMVLKLQKQIDENNRLNMPE
jgi:ribonuclease P protein component